MDLHELNFHQPMENIFPEPQLENHEPKRHQYTFPSPNFPDAQTLTKVQTLHRNLASFHKAKVLTVKHHIFHVIHNNWKWSELPCGPALTPTSSRATVRCISFYIVSCTKSC